MANNTAFYTLYKHTFPNNKVYIGITKQNPIIRWRTDGSGYKRNPLMWKAIQKYGWNNIQHEIIYTGLTEEEANTLEVEVITQYNATNPEYGYNIWPGGLVCSGWAHSEETKQKLSVKNKGKRYYEGSAWNKGLHAGRTTIYQYSLDGELLGTFTGYWEASQALGIPLCGISDSANGLCKTYYGYTFSKTKLTKDAVLDKIKSYQGAHQVTIYQYDNTGTLLNTYISYKQVMDALGIAEGNLENCLNGRQKTSHGYVFSKIELSKEDVISRYQIKPRSSSLKITVIDKTTNISTVYYNVQELAAAMNTAVPTMRNVINGSKSKLHKKYIFIKEKINES